MLNGSTSIFSHYIAYISTSLSFRSSIESTPQTGSFLSSFISLLLQALKLRNELEERKALEYRLRAFTAEDYAPPAHGFLKK